MDSDNIALSYLLQKIYYRFIKNLIEKDYSLNDLVKELKIVGLVKPNTNVKKIEDYINANLQKEWDNEEKAWKESRQASFLTQNYEVDEEIQLKDLTVHLSDEDTKTLLKDMKHILSNTKRVVRDIEKIVGAMDEIVVAIQPKYKEE
ncbi:MAG: hypothetical protein N4A62_15335 [Marinisporobacter sp.]|jgi:hypothetical protein|nr:hypothetical protein [Marinisporobacter sp.]